MEVIEIANYYKMDIDQSHTVPGMEPGALFTLQQERIKEWAEMANRPSL